MNYWKECVSEAFDDAGIAATEDQINTVASWVEGAHENYGMAHGHDCIGSPLEDETKHLRLELKREKEKVLCRTCRGSGREVSHGPVHSSSMGCLRCNGEGRHAP